MNMKNIQPLFYELTIFILPIKYRYICICKSAIIYLSKKIRLRKLKCDNIHQNYYYYYSELKCMKIGSQNHKLRNTERSWCCQSENQSNPPYTGL